MVAVHDLNCTMQSFLLVVFPFYEVVDELDNKFTALCIHNDSIANLDICVVPDGLVLRLKDGLVRGLRVFGGKLDIFSWCGYR
jgi:predicted amidohydrolase